MFDPHANLIEVTVTVAPSPATSGTTLSISDSDATALDNAGLNPSSNGAFNGSVAPSTARTPANTEIIRLTAKGSSSGGNTQYTISRQTETGGVNRSIQVGDVIKVTLTKKTITDLERLFNEPQSHMINGKIVTSVASNNLTVAIKTHAGADPSPTDPVSIQIGSTRRTITSALSLTVNAGSSIYNAGSSELAAKEVDYFVYLMWSTITNSVILGISRKPGGKVADTSSYFSATSTNPRFLNTSASYNTTDEMECIGRYNATNSGSASYNWSIPSTSVIVNHPINETRWLNWTPTHSATGSMTASSPNIQTAKYKIVNDHLFIQLRYTVVTGGTASVGICATLPFERIDTVSDMSIGAGHVGDGASYMAVIAFNGASQSQAVIYKYNVSNFVLITVTVFGVNGSYSI